MIKAAFSALFLQSSVSHDLQKSWKYTDLLLNKYFWVLSILKTVVLTHFIFCENWHICFQYVLINRRFKWTEFICKCRNVLLHYKSLYCQFLSAKSLTWLHRYYLNWTELDDAITKFNNEMHSAENWVLNPVILHYWHNLPILILCSALLQFVLLKALYK